MAKLYYNLIHKGLKTIKDVPVAWRESVQEMLDVDTNQSSVKKIQNKE